MTDSKEPGILATRNKDLDRALHNLYHEINKTVHDVLDPNAPAINYFAQLNFYTLQAIMKLAEINLEAQKIVVGFRFQVGEK